MIFYLVSCIFRAFSAFFLFILCYNKYCSLSISVVTVSVLESANGYSVPEDTGEVEVCFHILTGKLGTDVLVNLGTSQSSASAEGDIVVSELCLSRW